MSESTDEKVREILSTALARFKAELDSSTRAPKSSERRVRIDLSTDRSIAVQQFGFPMRSISVVRASDTSVAFEIIPDTDEDHRQANSIPMEIGSSYDFGRVVSRWYVKNAAQASKWVDVVVSIDGSFRSNKVISQNAGGVSISEGSSGAMRSRVGLTAANATATIILPSDTDRKVEVIQNHTGVTWWLGYDSNVTDDSGNYPGFEWGPKDFFTHKNTAPLYGIQYSGATITNAKIARGVER